MNNRVLTITSSAGNWIESGTTTRLTVANSLGRLIWNPPTFGSIVEVPVAKGCPPSVNFVGTGFGKVDFTVTDDSDVPSVAGKLTLWVGSVVVAGADGQFWQLKAGQPMSITPIDPKDLDPMVPTLIQSNAVIADLTTQDGSTAVTCYLLNLKSFAPRGQGQS